MESIMLAFVEPDQNIDVGCYNDGLIILVRCYL